MKMNDWCMPICGLKPAGTGHKTMLRSCATHNQLSSGGGLKPLSAKIRMLPHLDVDVGLDIDLDLDSPARCELPQACQHQAAPVSCCYQLPLRLPPCYQALGVPLLLSTVRMLSKVGCVKERPHPRPRPGLSPTSTWRKRLKLALTGFSPPCQATPAIFSGRGRIPGCGGPPGNPAEGAEPP